MSVMTKRKPIERDRHKSNRMVRVPEELYQSMKELAERNKRPVTWEIRLALELHLERHGAGSGGPAG